MSVVYLSLGSNIDQQKNIVSAVGSLAASYPSLEYSSVYESESVGFSGNNFYNLVARIETNQPLLAVHQQMRAIEDQHGRVRGKEKFSDRSLDIDILSYDNLVGEFEGLVLPRNEITKNAFVLLPLAELAENVIHPSTNRHYRQLWHSFDQGAQKLWKIDIGLPNNRLKQHSHINNFVQLTCQIACSGQPAAEQLNDIALLGYDTVINLAACNPDSSPPFEDVLVTQLGLNYLHIPVALHDPSREQFNYFCEIMSASDNKRVWLHCAKNRCVSVFLYLYRKHVLAVADEDAYASVLKIWQPDSVWLAFIAKVDASFEQKLG